jgi:hypothetical protein
MQRYYRVDERPFAVQLCKGGTPVLVFDAYAPCGGLSDAFAVHDYDCDVGALLRKHFPEADPSRLGVLQTAVRRAVADDAYVAADFWRDIAVIEISWEEFDSYQFLVDERAEADEREQEEQDGRDQDRRDREQ